MFSQTRYNATAMAANTTVRCSPSIGGFICVTSGTITITSNAGVVLLNAFPVTLGNTYGFSIFAGSDGGTAALAGGASGTLCH